MFHSIDGLPLHPLVVHAVVVLLPLTSLGVLASAFVPALRRRLGALLPLGGVVSFVLTPVATQSGEFLERKVGDPGKHAELGDQLIWFALALAIVAVAQYVAGRRADASVTRSGGRAPLATAVTVLAVLVPLASLVQVYRVGESGARAAWGGVVEGPDVAHK